MTRDIERLTGVPVVSITYDGTGQYQNEGIVPYVKYAAAAQVTARSWWQEAPTSRLPSTKGSGRALPP